MGKRNINTETEKWKNGKQKRRGGTTKKVATLRSEIDHGVVLALQPFDTQSWVTTVGGDLRKTLEYWLSQVIWFRGYGTGVPINSGSSFASMVVYCSLTLRMSSP